VVIDANVLVSFFVERNEKQRVAGKTLLLSAEEGEIEHAGVLEDHRRPRLPHQQALDRGQDARLLRGPRWSSVPKGVFSEGRSRSPAMTMP
jgi:hypothetical protein